MTVIPFPDHFLFGTSLSSHQSEGGNTNSWTEWENIPGHIKNGEKSGAAAEHWTRYVEDFRSLKWLNANTHRFSVEWSRLEPEPGRWNNEAFRHYRGMITALRELGVLPILCLFHFSVPIWVSERGGFENASTIADFKRFAQKCHSEFGDLVDHWLTLNEPTVYALGGYAAGLTPPGVRDFQRTMRVMVNMLRAHGHAYHAIKNLNSKAQVSFAQHLRIYRPKFKFWILDRVATRVADQVMNWAWFEAIRSGHIKIHAPFLFHANEEASECLGALDFLSFNYYSRDLVHLRPLTSQKFFLSTSPRLKKTDMGWDVYPEGVGELLSEIKRRGFGKYRLLISENGIADSGDEKRARFIYEHLRQFLDGCRLHDLKPMGYLYWSLIDNFEWIDGFGPRFGLIAVDYASQKRTPRQSAHYFREMGRRWAVFEP